MKYCFGVDIGGTTVKLGLLTAEGTIVEKWEVKTITENEGAAIIPDVVKAIQDKITEKQIAVKDIIGVGVGVPAPVSEEGIVNGSANLGWKYKEVKGEMEEALKLPVVVGNDANVAALGEMWKGGGEGYQNLVMVTLGTGVGGGVIIKGKVVTGTNGAGGEIGHVCVNADEVARCGCGKTGCVEQYASATGIARLAGERLEKDEKPSILRGQHLSAKTVFDAVKEDDEVADEIAEEFGKYLGLALTNIAVIVDPEVFVIGGGVSKAGNIVLSYVEKYFQKYAFFANRQTQFALATLENDAGIYGAAKMILDK